MGIPIVLVILLLYIPKSSVRRVRLGLSVFEGVGNVQARYEDRKVESDGGRVIDSSRKQSVAGIGKSWI
jgi:hypothetical protein